MSGGRPRALVLAAVREPGGPALKMRGLAAALQRRGYDVDVAIVPPDRSAHVRLAAVLDDELRRRRDGARGSAGSNWGAAKGSWPDPARSANDSARDDADRQPLEHSASTHTTDPPLVLARSHWSLPRLLPRLHALRRRGYAIVIDSPTPVGAGVWEVNGSARPLPQRAFRLGVETCWTPLAWSAADVLVEYEMESAPWRLLARRSRLRMTNGVDVATLPLQPEWAARNSHHLTAAGAISEWHGYDRLLRGMADPRCPSGVRLTVVGDGPALAGLRSLADRLGVADRVSWAGVLGGADFDAVMAVADAGIGPLAEHRRRRRALSPLKTRDYLARGLPVVVSGADPDLAQGVPVVVAGAEPDLVERLPWVLHAQEGDGPLDVGAIVAWLDSLRAAQTDPARIRAWAARRFSFDDRVDEILGSARG